MFAVEQRTPFPFWSIWINNLEANSGTGGKQDDGFASGVIEVWGRKVMNRYVKYTLWAIGGAVAVYACLVVYVVLVVSGYINTDGYVRSGDIGKKDPIRGILGINDHSSLEQLAGDRTQKLREKDPETLKKLRVRHYGKFTGLQISEPELIEWQMLEGAHVENIQVFGKSIPPEAWQWIQTIKGMGTQSLRYGREPYDPPRYDDDLTIELTDQPLDEAFYDGLNALLEGRTMDTLGFSVPGLNPCKVKISGRRVSNFRLKNSTLKGDFFKNPDGAVSFLSKRLGVKNPNPTLESFIKKCSEGEIK